MKLRNLILPLLLTLGVTACDNEPDYSGVYYKQNSDVNSEISFTKKDDGYLFSYKVGNDGGAYLVTIKKGEVYDHGVLRGTFSEDGKTYTSKSYTSKYQNIYVKK